MSEQDDEDGHGHMHGFGIALPPEVAQAIQQQHQTARGRAEDRYRSAMRWLDGLDVEGLMALRYILATDEDGALANNRFYDGVVFQLLRAKGVDPATGVDPAAQLLETAVPPASAG